MNGFNDSLPISVPESKTTLTINDKIVSESILSFINLNSLDSIYMITIFYLFYLFSMSSQSQAKMQICQLMFLSISSQLENGEYVYI